MLSGVTDSYKCIFSCIRYISRKDLSLVGKLEFMKFLPTSKAHGCIQITAAKVKVKVLAPLLHTAESVADFCCSGESYCQFSSSSERVKIKADTADCTLLPLPLWLGKKNSLTAIPASLCSH